MNAEATEQTSVCLSEDYEGDGHFDDYFEDFFGETQLFSDCADSCGFRPEGEGCSNDVVGTSTTGKTRGEKRKRTASKWAITSCKDPILTSMMWHRTSPKARWYCTNINPKP